MASNTSAQSSALRVIGPILSIVHARVIAPVLATRPNVGRCPDSPHVDEGEVIEPLVSVPIPNATHPAAVADAGPADEPLEPSVGAHGLRVRSPYQTSPWASAPSVSFARRIAPASSSLVTTVASKSNDWSLYRPAPHVVGHPLTASRSFAPHGMPCSGPLYLPLLISESRARACARARSSVSVMTQCNCGSYFLRRPRYISVSSDGFTLRVRTISDRAATPV